MSIEKHEKACVEGYRANAKYTPERGEFIADKRSSQGYFEGEDERQLHLCMEDDDFAYFIPLEDYETLCDAVFELDEDTAEALKVARAILDEVQENGGY